MQPDPETVARLTDRAVQAAARAYAPYSRFRVGAALLLEDGSEKERIITGANVENASFGLTSCAERNAIFRAVAELGASGFTVLAVAVANLNGAPSSPCGACLQVMSEFLRPDTPVYFPGASSQQQARFDELMPFRFRLNPEVD